MLRNFIRHLATLGSSLYTGRPEALTGPNLAAMFSDKLASTGGSVPTVIVADFDADGAEMVLTSAEVPALGVYGTAANPERIRVIRAEIVNVTDGVQADYWRTTSGAGATVETCVIRHTGAKFAAGIVIDEGDADEGGDATITIGEITGINDGASAGDRLSLRLYCI